VISLGARYIDYGLTGGLFLFVGMALFGWCYPTAAEALWQIIQNKSSGSDTKALETLLNGIFASLFVVCVFATGLILDLTGSILVMWEVEVFAKHIERNKAWIGSLAVRYEEFLGEDMKQILTLPSLRKRWWRPQIIAEFKLIAPFSRIESILLSHLLLTVDPTRLETLMDQVRTCRIARAVSSGLWILTLTFAWMPMIADRRTLWTTLIVIVGLSLSIFVIRRAYSKFCSNLFSLLFVLVRTPVQP
jgi:hypothetical protein